MAKLIKKPIKRKAKSRRNYLNHWMRRIEKPAKKTFYKFAPEILRREKIEFKDLSFIGNARFMGKKIIKPLPKRFVHFTKGRTIYIGMTAANREIIITHRSIRTRKYKAENFYKIKPQAITPSKGDRLYYISIAGKKKK